MPSDLILESDALLITQHIDAMPEAEKAKAADVLKRYRVQQEAGGAPLFPAMIKQQVESREKLWSAFDDPKALDKENGVYAEADRLEPGLGDNLRASELQARFLAQQYGKPVQAVRDELELYSLDYGAKNWNEAAPLEPQRFVARAKLDVVKQRNETRFAESLDDDAFQFAFEGGSFRGWLEQAKTKPGFDPKKSGEYLSRWNTVQRDAKAKLGENIQLVREVFNAMKQEVGQGEDTSGGADYWKRPTYELNALASEDPEAYKRAISALEFMARREAGKASDKGTPQATGEALFRGVQRILGGAVNATQTVVGANVADAVGADQYAQDLRGLSKVDNDLRRIAQRVLDPTTAPDSPWWRKMSVGLAESSPSMLGSMNKLVGLPLLAGSYVNDARETFRERGWEGKDADASALVAGVAMSAIERVSELPFVDKFTAPLRAKLAAFGGEKLAGRILVNAAMRAPAELGEEFAQDLTPSVVQAALGSVWADVPDVNLQKEAGEWVANNLADTALVVLPLALLGAGVHTFNERDRAALDAYTGDAKNLAMLGEQKAAAIAAMPAAERPAAIQQAWQSQRKAERLEWLKAQSTVQRELASMSAKESARQMREAESMGVSMRWNGETWNVTLGNGQVVQADNEQAAYVLVHHLKQSANEDAAAAMLVILQGSGQDVTVSGESLFVGKAGIFASTGRDRASAIINDELASRASRGEITIAPGLEVREVKNSAQLEAVRAQAQALGLDDVEINGSNEVFADEVGRTAARIVLQRSTQQPLAVTALHERLEANLKRGFASGQLTEKGLVDALAVVAGVLDRQPMRGKRKDSADEQSVRERLDLAASGQLDGAALRELAVEIAVGEVIGRDRRGKATGFAPGAVSSALDAELLAARDVETMTALQKLKAWLSAVRTYIRGVLGVVRAVDKARAAGKLADDNALDSFIDDLLNLNDSKFAKAVERESFALSNKRSWETPQMAAMRRNFENRQRMDSVLKRFEKDWNPLFAVILNRDLPLEQRKRALAKFYNKPFNAAAEFPSESTLAEMLGYTEEEARAMREGGETFSLGRITAKQDAEYMAAVAAGDLATAQRMVDAAAKAAGYLPHADFRDSHRAPSGPFAADEEVENGDADASLVQVALGIHNQPDDYFDPRVGPRYYSYQDKAGMEAFRAIRAAIDKIQRGKKALVTVYRAVPIDIKNARLENRDWVTPSKTYAINHGESRFGEGEYRVIKESVLAENLFWDGNDIREWGKDDSQNYFYKNTENNIKLADPITRDESGAVIPLSQRFNEQDDRITFSLGRGLGDLLGKPGAGAPGLFAPRKTAPAAPVSAPEPSAPSGPTLTRALLDQAEAAAKAAPGWQRGDLDKLFTRARNLLANDGNVEVRRTDPVTVPEGLAKIAAGEDAALVAGQWAQHRNDYVQGKTTEASPWTPGLTVPGKVAATGKDSLAVGAPTARLRTAYRQLDRAGQGYVRIPDLARAAGLTPEETRGVLAELDDAGQAYLTPADEPRDIPEADRPFLVNGPSGKALFVTLVQETIMPDGAQLIGPATFSLTAYHGTPHKVDKFSLSKIGTGEGAQAYGWGLYFAEAKKTAKYYQDLLGRAHSSMIIDGKVYDGRRNDLASDVEMLIADAWHSMPKTYRTKAELIRELKSRKKQAFKEWKERYSQAIAKAQTDAIAVEHPGNLYTVELLPDESEFLDWDKPLSEQSEKVKAAFSQLYKDNKSAFDYYDKTQSNKFSDGSIYGSALYARLSMRDMPAGNDAQTSKLLASLGVKGIRYLDGGSRSAGDGARNYVIFDESLVKILEENGKPVEQASFSLSPVRRMELVENRLAVVLNQDSEQARKFAERANDRLQRLMSPYAGVPAAKTKAELDKQQAGMVEARRAELEDILTGEVEARLGGVNNLATSLRGHPLGSYLLRSDMRRKRLYLGGLMPPARWRAEQLVTLGLPEDGKATGGSYDGAGDLPGYFFRGNQRPDDVAKEAFGLGLLDGDSTDDLYNGISAMLNELATNKADMQKYREQLREARQTAKEEAEFEGRAWRAEEDERQAFLGNPREAARRDIAAWEAVAMALPPEARAKLPRGLSASIAGAKSDKAFADTMTRAIRAVDAALQDYWKAKNIESMNKLVMLGQGKTSPGKKPRGTATPEVHRYFNEVANVVNAKAGDLAVMRLGIAQTLEGDEVPDNEAELSQRLNVIDTWGGFAEMSVKDQTAALETGWETYRAGRNAWWEAEAARLEAVRANAQTVLNASGPGTTGQLLKTRAKRGQVLSAVGGTFVDVGQFMRRLLGDIPLVQQWERRVADAFVAKEASLGRMRKKWEAALEAAMPGRSKSQRERRFYEMHTKRLITVELTEEKMNALLNAKQRQEMEDVGWTQEQITDKATLTEAEAMTVLLTWAQPRYRSSLQRSGFTADIVATLEQSISEEARFLRDWMRDELQAQHGPLNEVFQRMAGIDLPQTPNYWPGRFYSAGVEQEVDVMGQSAVGKGFADGFLKERKNHAAYVKLENAFATFWAHINQSEHWRNLAEPVREMRGVFRNPQVKRGVEAGAGKQALNDMNSWLDVLEANGTQGDSGAIEKVLSRWLGAFSLGRLAWNPFSIIRQAPAMFNVGLDAGLTPGMLFKGAGSILRDPSNFLDIYSELFASDVVFARLEGGMSPEVRNALNEFWKSGPGIWKGALDKGMELLGFTDALFTTIGGVVAYEAKAIDLERAGVSPEEAHAQAMQAAREAMEATAQPTTVNRKSLMEARSQNAIKKSVMMFLSDGRQKWAYYQESVIDILKNGKKAKRESWNRLLWTWLVIGPASQIITSAIRDSMDGGDDDEIFDAKNWTASDFVISSILGPLRGFFLAGQIVETMADRAAGRKIWGNSGGGVTDIPDEVAGDIARLAGYATDDKDQSAEQYGNAVLSLMSNVGGVPGMIAGTIKKAIKLADQE